MRCGYCAAELIIWLWSSWFYRQTWVKWQCKRRSWRMIGPLEEMQHRLNLCTEAKQNVHPLKPKAKNAEYEEDSTLQAEAAWQDQAWENEEYEASKGKKGKGKRTGSRTGSRRERAHRDPLLQDLLNPRLLEQTELSLNPNQKLSCLAYGFLFAMMTTSQNLHSADHMVCTVADPQKKLPVLKPGKWSISAQRRMALYGHDAKSMKNFTLHFDSDNQCESLDRLWFGEVRFPVENLCAKSDQQYLKIVSLSPQNSISNLDKMSQNCAFRNLKRDPQQMRYLTAERLMFSFQDICCQEEHVHSRSLSILLCHAKEKARCWRNEKSTQKTGHIHFFHLLDLHHRKFIWENGQALTQCRDKGRCKIMTKFEFKSTITWHMQVKCNLRCFAVHYGSNRHSRRPSLTGNSGREQREIERWLPTWTSVWKRRCVRQLHLWTPSARSALQPVQI